MLRLRHFLSLLLVFLFAPISWGQVNAFDDDFLVNENEVWTGNLGENDIVPIGQTATFSVVEGPNFGSFNFTTGGNFQYTPPLNQFGFRDSIYYQVCANNVCDIAGVEFYVIFRNTIPFAGNDFFSVEFNTPRIANVTNNDGDPDSITDPIDTSLDWFKFTNPTNGIVNVFAIDGTFTYTPNSGYIGNDSFQYYVVDHCGLYAIATVNLTVVGPNQNPTASDQTITALSEDVVYSGSLLPLVSDPENDAITFSVTNPPASGSLQLNSNGSYTYSPQPNFTGTVSFTFNACDVVGQCDQGIVTLTINNVDNDPPQLVNDSKILNEDSTGLITASTNDFDDTGVLTYSIFSQPSNGTVALINANGQFSYTPVANFFGLDSFVIQACDGVNCATSIVNVQVNGVNDAPTALPFTLTLNEDSNSSGTINTVTDAEPNALVYSTPGGNAISGLVINSNGTFNYTAPANYFGTQTINIQGCDPQGLCAGSTFTIIVNSLNDLPIAASDTYSINEDQPLSGNLSNGEYDVEGGSLTYTTTQVASNGLLNLSSNGQFTYSPNTNWFGTETININVCDSQNGCTGTQLIITVASVNDLPTTSPANLSANEDNALTGTLSSFAFDVETTALIYSLQTQPASGTFNLSSNGSYTFTPSINFNGTLSASYQVCDASNACVSGIITINVASVNDAPVASNFSINLNEDQTSSGVVAGISDVDHSTLVITITSGAQNGNFTLSNNGTYNYVPNANYFGSESITYNVCDPLGLCASGTLSIQIASVEDLPQAMGESLAVIEGNLLTGNLSTNDFDGDGDLLSYSALGVAQNGTLVLNTNGSFSFLPNDGFLGSESVGYLVCDGNGNCASATLNIDVLTSNTGPSVVSSAFTIDEDETLSSSLLEFVTDAEGGIFTFITLEAPAQGSIQWLSNGNFVFTPSQNFYGNDSFTYRVCDNGLLCAEATVSITIQPVNDAPVVSAITYVAFEDMSASENIGEYDFDIENEAISYQLISSPAHGIGTLNENGVLEYTPNANYNGFDLISYQACDASGACTLSELEILVLSVNDNPIAQPDFITIQEDESAIGIIEDLVTDADNESLFFGTMISPSNGMLVIQNNGNYTYTPNGNFSGADQFTYLVCDGTGICDTATIQVTVASVNDAPTAVNDSLTINEEETIELNLAANDFEIENQLMSYELEGISSLGNISLSTQGVLYFEANENTFGTESLTIHVCDSEGLCSESEVLITINPINDLPTISLEAFSLEEDSQISIDLANYVSDIEGSPLNFALAGNAENGMIEFSQAGIVSYIPYENYFGNDAVAFTVCDTENGCTEGVIEFNITSVNDEPESQNSQITLSEDSATEGNFNELVSDADGEDLFFTILQNTQNGTFIASFDGSFVYAPTANFFGWDTLSYMACDASGACDSSIISFEITFVNDLPIINSEGVQIIINNTVSGTVADNDIELDFETLVYTMLEDNSGGTFLLQSDGSYTYTPANDTTGLFTVNYAACDPCSACEYGTLSLLVVSEENANTPPTANNFTGQTCPGGSIAINLFNSISDNQESSEQLNLSFGTANSGNYQLDAETQELIYQASPFASGVIVIPYYVCDNGIIQMCDTAEIMLEILPQSTIEITGFQSEQISCFGANDGSIEINATTTLGNIQYDWNNGSESASIDMLAPGSYSVIISSDAPCPINQSAQFDIFEPSELIGTYNLIDADGTNSTIGDSIQLSISGGTPGYTITWNTPNGTILNELAIEINLNGEYSYTITDNHDCTFSESVIIASIQEQVNSSSFLIYPNPIDDAHILQVQGESDIIQIDILDSKGTLITTTLPKQTFATLETANWSSGLYSMRIHTSRGISTYRLIKQ